jgi:hypothetical protein
MAYAATQMQAHAAPPSSLKLNESIINRTLLSTQIIQPKPTIEIDCKMMPTYNTSLRPKLLMYIPMRNDHKTKLSEKELITKPTIDELIPFSSSAIPG